MDNNTPTQNEKAIEVEKQTGQITIKAENIPNARVKISLAMLFLSFSSICTTVYFVTKEYFSIKSEISDAQKNILKFQESIDLAQKIQMENTLSNLNDIDIDDCQIIDEAIFILKTKKVKNNCK